MPSCWPLIVRGGTGRRLSCWCGGISGLYMRRRCDKSVRDRLGAHLADDITQAVFILLSNKAGTIRSDVMLRDWLFLTTRYAARMRYAPNARRRHHERVGGGATG